ncbi:MAG: DNA recombination protein RmuC [Phycisphaeraceae bacterium]|nr:DNA recombination protein RmuC [Phycisphaeraceae bacterium]
MLTAVIIVLSLLLLILAIVTGALWVSRKHLSSQISSLVIERDQAREQAKISGEQTSDLKTQLELARQELTQKTQAFEDAQKQAKDTFASLANETLNKTSEQFLQLAKKSLESENKDATAALEQRKQAIESMLKPIREQLEQHAKAVTEMEKNREGAYQGLRQQITNLLESQQHLSQTTTQLSTALKGSSASRGRWGELALRRIVELAGMVNYCDFDEQVSIWKGNEQQRPDMVVHLPSDRNIVIDSKAVGESYLKAMEMDDEQQRTELIKQHANQIESRVRDLSRKDYTSGFTNAPDFVVLFIPGDSFLPPAMQAKPSLVEDALSRGVVIATPSTLVSLLKVVAMGWREQQLAENAQKVTEQATVLHERVATVIGHMEKLGKSLDTAVGHYNKMTSSFESRVLVSTKRLEEMGIKSAKTLPEALPELEATPRELRSTENGES